MPENLKTERYEDRPSSKIGLLDYCKRVSWIFLPFIGFAAGLGLRKWTKLPILEQVSNPLNLLKPFLKQAHKDFINAALETGGAWHMRNGEAWGMGLGFMATTYHAWTTHTKQEIEIDQVAKDITALRAMESPNVYLKRENNQLRQQIALLDRHAPRSGSFAEQVAAQDDAAAVHER